MKRVVSILDAFQGNLTLKDVMEMPIPLLDDFFEAQISYLGEKRKAEKEAIKNAQGGKG